MLLCCGPGAIPPSPWDSALLDQRLIDLVIKGALNENLFRLRLKNTLHSMLRSFLIYGFYENKP